MPTDEEIKEVFKLLRIQEDSDAEYYDPNSFAAKLRNHGATEPQTIYESGSTAVEVPSGA